MTLPQETFADLPHGIRLCYTDEGQGAPILLVIGLGFQLIHWPRALIDALVARGVLKSHNDRAAEPTQEPKSLHACLSITNTSHERPFQPAT